MAYNMRDDIKEVYFTEEQLRDKVRELGARITEDYRGKNPLIVSVLKGSYIFMADLTRAIDTPCNVDFMVVSSYGNGTKTTGEVQIIKDIAQPIDILGDNQPTVIASTVTDWKIDQAMDEIEKGEFGGGKAITANMDNGGVTLGKLSDKIPADVQTKINEYVDQIKAGTLLTDDEIEAVKGTLG